MTAEVKAAVDAERVCRWLDMAEIALQDPEIREHLLLELSAELEHAWFCLTEPEHEP
jgi:hypothetical protein